MKIGLVSARCKNKDLAFNTDQIKKYLKNAKEKDLDWIFFGESFLQGFYSLSFDYKVDKHIGVSKNDGVINDLRKAAKENLIGLGFGYMEASNDSLYSSYLVVSRDGDIIENFRRVSKGWKKFRETDNHYKEGVEVRQFDLDGHNFTLALCGDLWDEDTVDMFKSDQVKSSVMLWPVHVDYQVEEWQTEMRAYHEQALMYSSKTLMVNNLMFPNTHGGAFVFSEDGFDKLAFDVEGILVAEL